MICVKCGVNNKPDAMFCANCGCKLPQVNNYNNGYDNNTYSNNVYNNNAYDNNGYVNNGYVSNGYDNDGYDNNAYENVSDGNENEGKSRAVLIVVLSAVAATVFLLLGMVLYMNLNTDSDKSGSHKNSSPSVASAPTDAPTESPEPTPSPTPEATEVPEYITEEQNRKALEEISKQKESYLDTARSIEKYESDFLNSASDQNVINVESVNVYEKWDKLLNNVYGYLKTTMSTGDFKKLQKEENDWIIEKENAIKNDSAPYAGDPKETEIGYSTAIRYTRERCYYLISLIK